MILRQLLESSCDLYANPTIKDGCGDLSFPAKVVRSVYYLDNRFSKMCYCVVLILICLLADIIEEMIMDIKML